MYLCMNAYLVSFGNIGFCGFKVPQLISGYVKKMPMFSNLSIRNIEKQFKKGLLIFYCKNRKRCIIWEHKLQLLKTENLTEDLINLVVEMYKLRLTVLKDFVEELFSFEDTALHDLLFFNPEPLCFASSSFGFLVDPSHLSCSVSVDLGSAASASFKNSLEMQVFGPPPQTY